MIFLTRLFAHLCGQQHVWMLAGARLPFCQRCTGLYVGAFMAVVLISALRLRPNRFQYWVHGGFLLLMIPYGFHLLPQGPIVRTSTGFLFGAGLVYFLALTPFTVWTLWKPGSLQQSGSYLLIAFGALGGLLTTLHFGHQLTAIAIACLGTLGLAALCSLVLLNLACLPRTIHQLSESSRKNAA